MEKKLLWFFVVALLAIDVVLLVQRRQTEDSMRAFSGRFQELEERAGLAVLKATYSDEEEHLVTGLARVPEAFPWLQNEGAPDEAVQFLLLASVDDCTNCIEDEVVRLNEMAVAGSDFGPRSIEGVFVDEDRAERAQSLIEHLSPPPAFPVTVENALAHLPGATTPLVLVIRSRDGKILDAHKPIPEDLTKRDTFYTRWTAAFNLG